MIDSDRLSKLEALEKSGVNAFPYSFERTNYSTDITSDYSKFEGKGIRVAGRLLTKRSFGSLVFATLQDFNGRIQLFAKADELGEEKTKFFESLDLGDIVGVSGVVTKTKKGEISVGLRDVTLLAKSLGGLPEKWHGIADNEIRYRKRHLDLIVNEKARAIFKTRTRIVSLIRQFLDGRGFLEVETPILQQVYGGANAKPFTTHFNALNEDLFLRISNEIYLKRLIIGDLERVYEFAKDFRNEGIDSTHNPEFTNLEIYQAYADYQDVMRNTEQMFAHIAQNLFGSTEFTYQTKPMSFKAPFARVSLCEAILEKSGVNVLGWESDADAVRDAKAKNVEFSTPTRAHIIDAFFDTFVLPTLWHPTFVCDYPEYMCPLTKVKRGNPKLAERFELFIAGKEYGNAYSELTDPREQRRKFEQQAGERKKGDDETMPYDEDFVDAMETGMPPTGGIGFGVDRLTMLLTDQTSIKEVMYFPFQRSEKAQPKSDKGVNGRAGAPSGVPPVSPKAKKVLKL